MFCCYKNTRCFKRKHLLWPGMIHWKKQMNKEENEHLLVVQLAMCQLDMTCASWKGQVNGTLNHERDVRTCDGRHGHSRRRKLCEPNMEVRKYRGSWRTLRNLRGLNSRSIYWSSGRWRFWPCGKGFACHSNTTRYHVLWQKNHTICSAPRVVKWIFFPMGEI